MKASETHDIVRKSYADMLKKAQEQGSCCATSPTAKLAGYGDSAKHSEAAGASLGCGNPVAFAGVREGDTVLDLGCGGGLDLLLAAEKTGPSGKVIGVDMTDEMVLAARRNAARAGFDNIEVRKGLIEHLPVEDGSVDWVISNCVINLSPDKTAVFREIARVMKPGARFMISDMVVGDLPEVIRESVAAWSACVAGAISENEYSAGLREAGLEDVEVSERLVYDAAQLRAILSEDIPGFDLDCDQVDGLLRQYAGSVWSARFMGRKPL
ncbi:arsenite methyltransferase [Seongchinamella unica]|uniref:Arsenite methyltransferase n=1 Tax=Seongchinamella unica TaxID=2547392 RepID=A0A4R5LMS6_9GAMM|nr:arsenite methyltransferase [Seongchinamella unica]TDG11360.1 arsenite methyltransferase [Seongchinamella unica]